ncbi:hypothetical protein K438DRAFT_857252 [Mycena galopus ATCC 62051]|nr:hypothetical protein K438DRAFT_857252 [Mycena galopus ATCC 62051]
MQDAARVAILGPGGIGKTSLAKSALHHPDVIAKYPVRYFVACDSAQTVENLAFVVATALGLDLNEQLPKAIVRHLAAQPSCLVVLDNFETSWEPIEIRSRVEDFLAALGDFPHVGLLVTMRGQERPMKTRWTRPFIPALKPLSSDAALKTFMDIADADEDEDAPHVSELLALTGNLPLAVTLMASATALEGCESVLARWKTESVSLLSDGYDKGTNLEASLRLSLSSPRMAFSPGALQLLSLLSLLPDGLLDLDLFQSSSPIPEISRSKSTLIRTSLAYIDGERLKVLAPVRELIRKIHPPSYTLVRPLYSHWARLLELWRTYQMPSGGLVQRLAGNAGNLNGLLEYALDFETPDLKEVVYGIFYLDAFTSRTYGESSPLMADISSHIERVNDNGLRGYYIWHRFQETSVPRSEAIDLIAQGSRFFRLARDLAGQCRLQYAVTLYYIGQGDLSNPSKHANLAFLFADQADDDIRRNRAMCMISLCEKKRGRFRQALTSARRAQWFASRIKNFQHETRAMEEEAQVWLALGNLSRAVDICGHVRRLIIAAGLQKTQFEVRILDFEADTHLSKTAYTESRRVHELILQYSSPTRFPLFHGTSRLTIVAIDVTLGAFQSADEVSTALEIPHQIFTSRSYLRGLPICDKVVADFLIGQGRTTEAVRLYERCMRSFRKDSVALVASCMHKLGDITLRDDVRSTTHWATTYLAFGKTIASTSVVAWAFRLLGDIFRVGEDGESAASLFQVALEEFTRMDIHRGKAECLHGLGEIAERRREYTVATEYFAGARRMFLASGMVR